MNAKTRARRRRALALMGQAVSVPAPAPQSLARAKPCSWTRSDLGRDGALPVRDRAQAKWFAISEGAVTHAGGQRLEEHAAAGRKPLVRALHQGSPLFECDDDTLRRAGGTGTKTPAKATVPPKGWR